jgi:dUTP pyrophosphatase
MTQAVRVLVQRLPHGQGLPLPGYATPGSAGLDLLAALAEPMVIEPARRAAVPTGIAIALPDGYEAQVRPRSGLALKHGLTLLNSPGTVDADYRGEIQVILINLGEEAVTLTRGMRVAQLVIAPVTPAALVEASELPPSARGDGGFGSTGTR